MSIVLDSLNYTDIPNFIDNNTLRINKQKISKDKKSLKASLKDFFTNPSNRVARYMKGVDGVDKVVKLSVYVADLCHGVFEHKEANDYDINTASKTSSVLRDARAVVGFTNVFRGAIPGLIRSVQECYSSVRRALKPFDEQQATQVGCEEALPYNKIMLSRGDYVRHAITSGCTALGAATYCATFGIIRPIALANKCAGIGFLDSTGKAALSNATTCLMTANHAAVFIGQNVSLWSTIKQYKRAKQALERLSLAQSSAIDGENEEIANCIANLRRNFWLNMRDIILTIVEKTFELSVDLLKIIVLPLAAPALMIIKSALSIVFSMIGVYKVWLKTG